MKRELFRIMQQEFNFLPEKFYCAGFTITVNVVDRIESNSYGNFCDATNIINIAKTVKTEEGTIEVTKRQMLNTFWHEVIHVWQFYFNNQYDEAQAQVFANFMCEYESSKGLPF